MCRLLVGPVGTDLYSLGWLTHISKGTVAGASLIARSVYNGELEVGVFVMYLTYVGSILSNCK